jgi:hypothetical protein
MTLESYLIADEPITNRTTTTVRDEFYLRDGKFEESFMDVEKVNAYRKKIYDFLGSVLPVQTVSEKRYDSKGHKMVSMDLFYYDVRNIHCLLEKSGCKIRLSRLEESARNGKINREIFVRILEEKRVLGKFLNYIESQLV